MISINNILGIYDVDREMAKLGTLVLSRNQVLSWEPTQDDLSLISIRDAREKPLPLDIQERYGSVLELVFDDVLEASPWPDRKIFDLEDAEKLWHFFKSHLDRPIVIHCHAGISRSAGVAMCRAFHDRSTLLLKNLFSDKFSANPTVVRKFLEYAELRQNRSLFMRWDKN